MLNRRDFLTAGLCAGVVAPEGVSELLDALARNPASPAESAADEAFWSELSAAFRREPGVVNLNNGGVSPTPAPVLAALRRETEYALPAPAYRMWHEQAPRREGLRARLAAAFGCDAEELAIVRNASEGLQTCQLGLSLARGDEVLTTDQDYPRMLNAFKQREAREGIRLRQIPLPIPCEDDARVVRAFEEAIGERTKLILMCHVINLTGQILPVRAVVRMARERGIPVLVDGAHAFAHFPFTRDELDCDFYATSLHKWLFAPWGTGFLYVRRERVREVWPLMAAREDQHDDVRKFEEIGTHSLPLVLSIDAALDFHEALGVERKAARLVWLRDRWARRLGALEGVRLYTSLAPGRACGIATVGLEGVPAGALAAHLQRVHGLYVAPIVRTGIDGVRISPSVYTSAAEIDLLSEALEDVLAHGLPG